MHKDLIIRAKEIIEYIPYITIATSTKEGQPWNTPVYAVHNEKYEFFWISWIQAQHSKNIRENKNIFVVVYDPTRKLGDNHQRCLYMQMKAYELQNENEIKKAIDCFSKNSKELKEKKFIGEKSVKKIYKAVPENVWLNDKSENQVTSETAEMRIEVSLEQLRKSA